MTGIVINENGNVDDILSGIGELGPYQIVSCMLLFLIKVMSGQTFINYMITTKTLEYRCKVPECEFDGESDRNIPYNQSWLSYAIPSENGKLDNCHRYVPKNLSAIVPGQCNANMFDTSTKISCNEFIYASDERNIQTEFNIHCSESYKLAFVATAANIARIIFLPLSGLLSDRFGRLPVTVIGSGMGFVFGVIKTFSVNYRMYVALEFLEAAAHGCVFTGIYVFAIELFNEKHHVLGYVTAGIGNSVGDLLFGVTVMFLHDFRTVLRIFNIPGLFVFFYFLFICESVRWLLATGRIDRAITTIKRIAKFNRLELSEKAVESIKLHYSAKQNANEDEKEESVLQLFWTILKTRTLCFRFVNGCLQWILCCFSYYGVYQHATQIPGSNHYVSFVILIAVATPMNLLVHFLFNRLKRRIILFCAYFVGGIMIIITLFIPKGQVWAVVICYIISKSLIGFAFTGSYIYAAEQFPTNIRATMLNTFNMVGRFGSMSAPYVIILASQHSSLPPLLFSGAAILAAISVLFSPETFRKKLPDTIDEAINL